MNKPLKNTCKFITILVMYFALSLLFDMITPHRLWVEQSTEWIFVRGVARTLVYICAGTFFFMLIYIVKMGWETWRETKEERKKRKKSKKTS